MRKILCFLGLVFLVGCLFLPLVSAAYVCPAAYTVGSGAGSGLIRLHPSIDGYDSQFGMAFTTNASAYLYNVTFQLSKYGSPTNQLEAVLWSTSGTVGSTAVPSTALAVSSVVEASSLSGTQTNVTFTFDGTYLLQSSTDYAVTVCVLTSGSTTSNYAVIYFNNTGADATKNYVQFYSSTWHANVDDAYFIINGDSAGSGATPTPTPVPSGDGGDVTLEYWGDIVATWIFPILLVLVPAVIAAYYLGKIGFIIGLNIGMILGYAALPAIFGLWTVIMLVLVDVAYFFFARDR